MPGEWYYAQDGNRQGPVPEDRLRELAAAGRLRADDLVWQEGMPDWTPAGKVPNLFPAGSPPPIPVRAVRAVESASADRSEIREASSTKLAAGLCAIFVGSFGVHKFIIGATTPALIMLLVTLCTCFIGGVVMHIIGIVEGIIYLTKSDEEFYHTYIIGKKAWF